MLIQEGYMQNFIIRFQHPFEDSERSIRYYNKEQTLKSFLDINWAQLNIDIFEKHDDAVHDYYYFDISYLDGLNLKHSLNISGMYTNAGEELLFAINYSRPVEKSSRGFMGLGAPKIKIVLESLEMVEADFSLVKECLNAFLNEDKLFLETNVIHTIPGSFYNR